ncbi:MAG: ice-binding family protein [Verrucomicrobiaceae bacterium]
MAAGHATVNAQTVSLGTADSFAVLAGTTITNTGATTITGNVGLHPGTAIGGGITLNGAIHATDAVALQAKNDLVTAYNDAAGRSINFSAPADLAGLNLVAGVYKNASGIGLTGTMTLNGGGNQNAVWIFQIGSTLITASGSSVLLINGAQACNVFWQVGSSATLGTNSSFTGNVLALTTITAQTGASVVGRLLAQNGAVNLDTNTIVAAICKEVLNAPRTANGGGAAVSAAELKKALILSAQVTDVVSAQGLTSIYTLGFAQFDTEVFSLQQRFADIRRASRDTGAPGIFNPIPSGKNPRGGKNAWGGKGGEGVQPKQVQVADDDRFGFFITGTGDFATAGDIDGTSLGATIGMDCRLSNHFLMGVSIGYSHSESDFLDNSKVKSNGGKVALYGMYQRGGFFTEGLIGGGYNSYDSKRSAFLGNAYGDTSGLQFDSYLGMGYDARVGKWTITPMASLLYTLVGIKGYNEYGSLVPLKVDSQNAGSLRSRIGPRVAYTTELGAARVTPSFSAEWQHEFLDDQLPFDARFSNDANRLFTVHGPKIGRDSLLLTAALNVAWRRYATYLAYQADLGRKNYDSQSVLAGFRVAW